MIATSPGGAYLGGVTVARLIRMLVLLAVLISPLAMMDDHAAMATASIAAPAASHLQARSGEGHCEESASQPSTPEPAAPDRDCLLDCAVTCSVVPPVAARMPDVPFGLAAAPIRAPAGLLSGRQPESDPPPPRA